jgi:hypothetical protein
VLADGPRVEDIPCDEGVACCPRVTPASCARAGAFWRLAIITSSTTPRTRSLSSSSIYGWRKCYLNPFRCPSGTVPVGSPNCQQCHWLLKRVQHLNIWAQQQAVHSLCMANDPLRACCSRRQLVRCLLAARGVERNNCSAPSRPW